MGKKHYGDEEQVAPLISNPEPSVRKYLSVRNIMSVKDIEGASPSVAPEKVRNIMRAKEQKAKSVNPDLLAQYEKLFQLKQIAPQNNSGLMSESSVMSSGSASPGRRYNPTFVTSFALHY